jgi:hypothetical protein
VNVATWNRVSQPIGDVLPGFRPIKFGYARVGEWVAECIVAESSAFSSAAFYVQAFALPRFVPTDHLYFDYGFRIGERWEEVSAEVVEAVRDALPELSQFASFDGLLNAAVQPDVNLYHAEIRLCVSVLTRDAELFEEARELIANWTPAPGWEIDVLARCVELVRDVEEEGFPRGVATLEQRRQDVDRLLA